MKLIFHLSRSTLNATKSNFIPPIGSAVTIRTEACKNGLASGSLIRFEVGKVDPLEIEFDKDGGAIVHISVNGYEYLGEPDDHADAPPVR